MLWKGRRESGNVVDQRSIGGKSLGIGGLLIGAVIYYFMGGNPLVYLAENAGSVSTSTSSGATQSATESGHDDQKSFVSVVLADTEETWSEEFRNVSQQYQAPQLILFRNSTRSGCGSAGSETGPFYCPRDQRVYLDLSFFDELHHSLGAAGDTAAAYVVAHEVGHHVQNLLGLYGAAEGANSNQKSVAVELQADCLAGVWAAHENKNNFIEPGDIEEAMTAASAVGDDRLQERSGRGVRPESFTHGTSAQRVAAFRKGYDGGHLNACVRQR
jgi:predicted metalloprotease